MIVIIFYRMFPVAPFIVRTATADTPVSTCIIPKNAIIMMSIFNLQRVSLQTLVKFNINWSWMQLKKNF